MITVLTLFPHHSYGQYADVQKEVFVRQIKIAIKMKLPLVIHCRDAEHDCLEILKRVSECCLCANVRPPVCGSLVAIGLDDGGNLVVWSTGDHRSTVEASTLAR